MPTTQRPASLAAAAAVPWPFALVACVLLLASVTGASAQSASDDLAAARAGIMPLFEEMHAAANAHDAERHLAPYVRDPTLLFVVNAEAITGYDALLAKQREWWQHGKSDVTYTLVGEPQIRMFGRDTAILTYFLTGRRTMPDGELRTSDFAISSLWQKRPEGWRIVYAHESAVRK